MKKSKQCIFQKIHFSVLIGGLYWTTRSFVNRENIALKTNVSSKIGRQFPKLWTRLCLVRYFRTQFPTLWKWLSRIVRNISRLFENDCVWYCRKPILAFWNTTCCPPSTRSYLIFFGSPVQLVHAHPICVFYSCESCPLSGFTATNLLLCQAITVADLFK